MNVEVVRAIDVETCANHAFAHHWSNVGAAAIRPDACGIDTRQQFRDLLQVGSDLRRGSRSQPKSCGTIDSGIRLDREHVFRYLGAMRVAISITAARAVLFV